MTLNQDFLRIMKWFLQRQQQIPDLTQRTPAELEQLLFLANAHAVYPIVYEAVRQADGFQSLPREKQMGYKQKAKRTVILQTSRTMAFLEVYRQMLQRGLTPLVMKGIILRNLYQQPDYRPSGDEDLLIEKEDFAGMDALLLELGFLRDAYENPLQEHEITYTHPGTGVHLEVHLSLFPADSGLFSPLNREFSDIFSKKTTAKIEGTEIDTLDPTSHMLYLLCHGMKHFLYSGFGIRQLCDMVVFAQAYGPQIDWQAVTESAKRQRIYVFWMNLFDIGQRYLGFSWEQAGLQKPSDLQLDSDAMLDDIMDSGVFGKSSEDRLHSARITKEAAQNGKKQSLPLSSLFPDAQYLKKRYPYLREHAWLLPVAWTQRVVEYLKKNDRNHVSTVMNIGNARVELMKKYGLIEKNNR